MSLHTWQTTAQASHQDAVRESVNRSAASAASPDYIQFQGVIKYSKLLAQPPFAEAALAADLATFLFPQLVATLAAKK